MSTENENDDSIANGSELGAVAENEHEYLLKRLREELGREPTEEELDEWLRQHTEGY